MRNLCVNHGGCQVQSELAWPFSVNFNNQQITKFLSISCSFQHLLEQRSQSQWDSKVVVKGIEAVSQTAMCRHTCVIPSSPALLASTKPSLPALKSCHAFFMMAREPGSGLVRNSARRGTGRQMQCCLYIMGDRGRFDDQGLTETGLSSSISNLFVSAAILTDKQSACNIIWQNVIQPQLDLERWLSLSGSETSGNQFKRQR